MLLSFYCKKNQLKSKNLNVLRIYPLAASPNQVLDAIEHGFDLFTGIKTIRLFFLKSICNLLNIKGSYPFLITQNYHALMLDSEINEDNSDEDDDEYEVKAKRRRKEESPEKEHNTDKTPLFLDIKDKK